MRNSSEKYLKKLIGKTKIEDALKRLDRLTNEEVRMVTAQVLEATHIVDDRIGRVEDKVLDVDNKVTGVDDRVAHVDERVAGVNDNVKVIGDNVAVVIDGAQQPLISQQGNLLNSDVPRGKRDKASCSTSRRRHGSSKKFVIFFLHRHWCARFDVLTGNQLRQDLRRWLSPPDPAINHNIACGAHRKQTAEWFFQGSIFAEWKSSGSLLWLHGKRTLSYLSSADGC